tara:strand:- start:157 stop:471 length:315 start_codon:yes stop_codon:yes gene_type:complete
MPTEKKPNFVNDEQIKSIANHIESIEESAYLIGSAAQAIAKCAFLATVYYIDNGDRRRELILASISRDLGLDENFGVSKYAAFEKWARRAGLSRLDESDIDRHA